MSSASISEIKSYFIGNVGGEKREATEAVGQDSFSQIFDKTGDSKVASPETVKVDRGEGSSIQDHANIQKKSAPESLQDKGQVADEMMEEEMLQEAAIEAGAQMVEEVAKTFNVTVCRVEEVMEAMGLNPMDLFNQESLIQLVLGLNPEADALTIMTDEQLFADLKNLMSTAQDLMNQMAGQFGMSKEQMGELMAALQAQLEGQTQAVASQEQVQTQQDLPGQSQAVQDMAKAEQMAEEPQVEVHADTASDEQPLVQQTTKEAVPGQSSTEGANSQSTVSAVDGQPEEKKQPAAGNGEGSQQMAGESFTSNLLNQLSQAVESAAGTHETYGVSGQEIINQITEYIKVVVNADTTELELQLSPESLGNVKVQIASRAGVLTATFITENEAVKAVLEAQMIQLKESFEQQGLKVESVEVNVEARSFERSLDQQGQEQQSLEEADKRTSRRISLSGLEGMEEEILSEELSEGDRIVADMMIRNGNTVDFTA